MKSILLKLIEIIIGFLKPEMLKEFVDMILDWVENKVQTSPSDWDDKIFLPICATIRAAFDIPDND